MIVPWLKENYECEVITFTADLGQGAEELEGLEEKALASGACKAYIVDLREEFLTHYAFVTMQAGAIYEHLYLLGTSFARPITAQKMVEIAEQENAGAISHGCTGKGNDQVATDMRLYLLGEISIFRELLGMLQAALVEQAETHLNVYIPGYTHTKQAQPILFSHWLLAYFWKFQRDYQRLTGIISRTSVCPLGAGALAGNPFKIDRMKLAESLNFDSVSENSIDAVSDRDFVVEFLSWAALTQTHLSGWAEEMIIWASAEFGFLDIDEAYTTGSSLMPQKKNPDSLELIRGKSGRVVGHIVSLSTTLKGLPLAYNKDLQEDQEALFDVIDTLKLELPVATGVIRTMQVNADRMAAMVDDKMLATDLADYLVRAGVPFRKSHQLVGQVVLRAEELGVSLSELDLSDYQSIHTSFTDSVYEVFDVRRSIGARAVVGGTAPQAVISQIEKAKVILNKS